MTEPLHERLAAEAAAVDRGEDVATDMSQAEQTTPAARDRAGQVVALRLPPHLLERVRGVAAEQGIGPSTLMRQWVIDRLESVEGNPDHLPDALDRLARDVEQVRQLARR